MFDWPSNHAEWHQFGISFWSALISGLIYSIVVGIVVGVVLFLIQRISDRRRLRQRLSGELAAFKERMAYTLDQPHRITLRTTTKVSGQPLKKAYKLADGQPLNWWHDNLPSERNYLAILRQFQEAFVQYSTAANKLQARLDHLGDMSRQGKGHLAYVPIPQSVLVSIDDDAVAYAIGRIITHKTSDILRILNRSSNDDLEQAWQVIEQDTAVKRLSPDYIKAIGRVGAVAGVLRAASTFRDDRPLAVLTQVTQDIHRTTESWFADENSTED